MPRSYKYVDESNLQEKAKGWLEIINKNVKPRKHLVPNIRKSALLVIDMENISYQKMLRLIYRPLLR